MVKNNKKLTTVLVIYSVIFYAVWAVYELLIAPVIKKEINNDLFQVIDSVGVKSFVWALPAFLLVKKWGGEVSVPLKELFSLKRGWKVLLAVLVPMTAYIVFSAWKTQGALKISGSVLLNILIFLFVGLTEESVFRGWLFNAAVNEENATPAYAVNAAMFVMIHFPKWIADGRFIANIPFGLIMIALLSVLFSWSFRKTRNLLVPVILHFWWDLLVTLLN